MTELRAILSRACMLFPDGSVPLDEVAREKAVGAVGSSGQNRWDALDREVYAAEGACWLKALEHLQANRAEVLVAERE